MLCAVWVREMHSKGSEVNQSTRVWLLSCDAVVEGRGAVTMVALTVRMSGLTLVWYNPDHTSSSDSRFQRSTSSFVTASSSRVTCNVQPDLRVGVG